MASAPPPRGLEFQDLRALTLEETKLALTAAGFEIYRATAEQVHIAERVRMHLMDSRVSVHLGDTARVVLAVRCQRSDFAIASDSELFARVRDAHARTLADQGFSEVETRTEAQRDPMDPNSVLDVWYEVTFGRDVADADELAAALSWALALPKCVT